ncbi:MAG: MBL fold metallo-hydrolase [Clostridia bacterium]|nr:MBL fold metallo-hydrolase [Clostridia bacterium]
MAIKMLTPRVGLTGELTVDGVVFSDNGVIMIDNGWGRKQGREILAELEAIDKKLIAIINTHTHLDHAGANYFLYKETDCTVYCTLYESLMVRGAKQLFPALFTGCPNPIMDGLGISEALNPTKLSVIPDNGQVTIDGVTFDIISTPGHSDGHVAIAVDNILFCGDAIVGPDWMRPRKLIYMTNPTLELETLARIRESSYDLYVPSHGSPVKDPNEACDMMVEMLSRIETFTREALENGPVTLDTAVQHVSTKLALRLRDLRTYNTARVTIQCVLNDCVMHDTMDYIVKDNMFYYKKLMPGEIREAKLKTRA